MGKLKSTITTALQNKVILYIFSRYGTYFIHFINSLFIAIYLGPYYLGIWGFITLVTSYLNHFNFGIVHSATAIISVYKRKEFYVEKTIGASVVMLIILSCMITVFFISNYLFDINFGSKYNFNVYAPVVLLIGVLAHFNNLLSSIFRVYGKLFEIAFHQTIFPVLITAAIIFFKKEDLIWALVSANFLSFFLAFILYVFRSPVKLRLTFNINLFKRIQIKGWHLFVYNSSFFFIVISTRSLVSGYYSVEEFGYFTFAFSLSNVMLLLLQAFSYLIYPKLLNRFASANSLQNSEMLEKLRDAYVSTSHLLIHFAILFFPLLLILFPRYELASEAFKLIALSIVLYTNSFGYSGLLIAKGHEKKLGGAAFLALVVNVIAALILIELLNVPFTLVILSTLLSYFIYVFILGYMGRKILELNVSILSILKDIIPLRLFLPYFSSLCLVVFSVADTYFVIPLVLFLILNFRVLLRLKKIIKSIILNPNLINI